MNLLTKKLILKIADYFSILWFLVPSKIRKFVFTSSFILESRGSNSGSGLIRLFELKKNLDWVINERSISYDKGIHPKHRLTNYHRFFIDRINNDVAIVSHHETNIFFVYHKISFWFKYCSNSYCFFKFRLIFFLLKKRSCI